MKTEMKRMSRMCMVMCMVSSLAFHTSCQNKGIDSAASNAELKERVVDQRFQELIQQARNGNVGAYQSLALCYRDGEGVEKSWINMICMYGIYAQKTGGTIYDVVKLFDEGHSFKLLTEIFSSSSFNERAKENLELLKKMDSVEAKVIEALLKAYTIDDVTAIMPILCKAEEEGSEVAAIVQLIYYDELGDKEGKEECLIRLAKKYPVFYLFLGDIYDAEYEDRKNFSYIQMALECYYKADACGMLLPKYAFKLLNMCKNYGEKGMIDLDEKEMERLTLLAERKSSL